MRGCALVGLCFLFAAAAGSALEVQDVRWGFDGQAVPVRFNVLSVLVANPSAAPFDGTVQFYKTRGLGDRVGALYGTRCYVSPLTTRWLQFYVYVENTYDEWRLEWGRGPNDHHDLQPPKLGPPARVLLSDPETTLAVSSVFAQFPDDLFPPTAAATSGLDSLLLDHVPRWEPARRQALLDWLRAGGRLHLLENATGQYPVFSDNLGVLNFPGDRLQIGAGLVIRHAATARQIQKRDLEREAIPLRQPKPNEGNQPVQITDSFFRVLARLSQPRYNWSGIYLLALVYVAAAGPGVLLAGRKFADYRLRIVLLLATVAGFACLFNFAGRRGQGEASVVHSLSCARALDDDTYDVMQWVNVFATHGAHYTITHPAAHNLYATGQDYEAVNGLIENGKEGQFLVDIPMFSRRALLHAAEMKGPKSPLHIESWDGAETLHHLTLTAGRDFTQQILEGWVVAGDQVYAMNVSAGRLEFRESSRQPLNAFLFTSPQDLFALQYGVTRSGVQYGEANQEHVDVAAEFRKLVKPLIGWSLGDEDFTRLAASPAAANHVHLFLFARSPETFNITGSQFGREIGYVLYRFDLSKPGT